jgi:hypothetical protein
MTGLQPGTWNLEPGTAPPPTLIDAGVPGMLAIAWLYGITIPRGSRLLLGWVQLPASGSPPALVFYGVDAVTSEHRPAPLSTVLEAGTKRAPL